MNPTELAFNNCTLAILEDCFALRLQLQHRAHSAYSGVKTVYTIGFVVKTTVQNLLKRLSKFSTTITQ